MTQPHGSTIAGAVLVVDDEPMVRSVVCRMLEEWEFKTLEADSGKAALHMASRIKGALSMVITDVSMPLMDGYEFARRFRPLYPAVPILFMTGLSPDVLTGKMSNRGEPVIFKPFDPDAFLDAVAHLLQSRIHERRSTG